jgi:hypothetical protein
MLSLSEVCCCSLPLNWQLRANSRVDHPPHTCKKVTSPTLESNRIFHLAFSRVDHINLINMPLVNDAQSNIKSWRTRLGFEPIKVCGTSSWPAQLQFETLGLLPMHLWRLPGETEEEPTRSIKVRFSSCTMTMVPSWSILLGKPRRCYCLSEPPP